MAVTATVFGQTYTGQYSATAARRIDWATDTIKVALTTSAYTPNQDTHVFFSDVTNEITGTGYTAGGATLAGKSVSYDSASNETRLLASASSWASSSLTARRAVVYKDTGTAGTSPLIGWVDFGGDETTATATFTITWDATNGVTKVAAA
jgi:hypothetical protein